MTLSSTFPTPLDRSLSPSVSRVFQSRPTVATPSKPAEFHPYRLLEIHLQRQWQQRRRDPVPLQIRCTYQNDRLLVLAEHAQGIRPDARFTLAQLAVAMQHLDPKLHEGLFKIQSPQPSKLNIGLYLRILGEAKPYAAGGCTVQVPLSLVPKPRPSKPQTAVPVAKKQASASIAVPQPMELPLGAENEGLRVPSGVWLTGVVLCLSTFLGSFWFMMQPCYVRPCIPLTQAEQLRRSAQESMLDAENWDQLKTIAAQLADSQRLSRQVPLWSSYRERAKHLYVEVEGELAAFAPVTAAFEKAVEAVEKTKAPPYPVEEWQSIRTIWVDAIEGLRSIPETNPTYPLAQRKIEQYQDYVVLIDQEIAKEEAAQTILKTAERSAQLAQLQKKQWEDARESDPTIDRVDLLDRIEKNWQAALKTLDDVPAETIAFRSVEEHRQRYQKELDRWQTEDQSAPLGASFYQQAKEKAALAQDAERDGRWEIARNRWEVAMVNLQQVSVEDPRYKEAQALLPQYTQAYQQAESQAQQLVQMEHTRQELEKICATTPTICYYTVTSELIAVQLTLDYESQILSAGVWGDQKQAIAHLEGLESALETISNTAQIPLELYDPDGSLLGSHRLNQTN